MSRKNNKSKAQEQKATAQVVVTEATAKKVEKVRVTRTLEANVSDASQQVLRETCAKLSTREAVSDFEKLVALCVRNIDALTTASFSLSALIVLNNNTMKFHAHKSNEAFDASTNHFDLQRALHRERAARLERNVFKSCDALLIQNVDTTNEKKARLIDVKVASSAVDVLREYKSAIDTHNAK